MSSTCGWSLRVFRRPSGAASGQPTTSSSPKASSMNWQRPQSKTPSRIAGPLLDKTPRAKGVLGLAAEKGRGGDRNCPKRVGRGVFPAVCLRDLHGPRLPRVEVANDGAVRVRPRRLCSRLRHRDQSRHRTGADRGAQSSSASPRRFMARLPSRTDASSRLISTPIGSCAMNEAPVVEVHIVQSSEPPGGMGECGTSAVVPRHRQCDLRCDEKESACARCLSTSPC